MNENQNTERPDWAWHIHHEILVEELEPDDDRGVNGFVNRATDILWNKDTDQQVPRLFLFRAANLPFTQEIYDRVEALKRKEAIITAAIDREYDLFDVQDWSTKEGDEQRIATDKRIEELRKQRATVKNLIMDLRQTLPGGSDVDKEELLRLHKEQCDVDCTWEPSPFRPNSGTIFPSGWRSSNLAKKLQGMSLSDVLESRPEYEVELDRYEGVELTVVFDAYQPPVAVSSTTISTPQDDSA